MNAHSKYTGYLESARESLIETKWGLLLAYGEAPDCFTEQKILKIIQVLNLIDIEMATLKPPAT